MRLSCPARSSSRLLLLISSLLTASSTAALAQEFDATALAAPVDLAAGWRVCSGDGEAIPVQGALLLGIVAGANFSVTHFKLNESDRLVLISDGIAEAKDAKGELFGFDRMIEMLRTRQSFEQLASAVQNFGQEDDITLLSLVRQHAVEKAVGVSLPPAFSWEPA